MFNDFQKMPKSSRVWIYQANRDLTGPEVDWLEKVAQSFCENWQAHGQDLSSSYRISHNRFLILAADEGAALPSGCSIDSSVRLVTEVQKHIRVDFFDRTAVAFLDNGKVKVENLNELKDKVASGEIMKSAETFNNLVTTIDEMENNWLAPASETWLKKYFN